VATPKAVEVPDPPVVTVEGLSVGASYGTPQVSLLGASSTGWSNDKLALSVERSPLEKDRHRRRPIATVSPSTAIRYPHPQRPRRSTLAESGQHGGVDPNFPAYSGRTQRHPIRTTRFRSSQACDPKLWGSPKRHRFDTPTRYIMRASEPRFRSSEALSGTWWQVKDSNLRSFRDGFTVPRLQACDQRKRLTHNNFRAYSPQTADVSRG
jgi:hypothetical protein